MLTKRRALLASIATSAAVVLGATGCTSEPSAKKTTATAVIEIQDNHGTQNVNVPPRAVIATDNRLFQTLADWGVDLAAAPVDLIAADNPYTKDSSIKNLGTHREPDLEAIVAVEPDLIVNGQRFSSHYEDIKKLVPDTPIVELDPREGQPLDKELKRQTVAMGRIFGHENDAQELVDKFDASIKRAKAAYDPATTVIGLITSGGELNYAAPSTGRTVGPVFDVLGLTPAIKVEGSSDHKGDDISVEAVAAANPGLILVLDRDAAVNSDAGSSYVPANQLLTNSEALKNVAAVTTGNVVYFPKLTYLNEGIQTYTTIFNQLADKFEASK